MIALNNLEIFDDSRIQRFCCISKLFFYQSCNIFHGTLSIDQWPDKCPLSVQMNFGVLWFVEQILSNFVKKPCILNIQYS